MCATEPRAPATCAPPDFYVGLRVQETMKGKSQSQK